MADLVKVSIQGTLPGGEIWSINPVWRINVLGTTVSVSQCQAIVTAVNAIVIPTGFRNIFNTSTNVTGCRVEARTNTGVLQSLAEGTKASSTNGAGASPHPFQTSLVVSLRTPIAGASGRGRLYIPATGMNLTPTTLRPTVADITSALTGTKQYLGLIGTAVTASVSDTILGVWSRKLTTVAGVTRIQMGDVLDVQRRRRDAQIENYQEAAWP